MVSVFARELTGSLAGLVRKLDRFVAQNDEQKAAAFLVLLTDDPDGAELKLQEFAEKHGIKHVPLTVFDGIAGPPDYKIAEEADLTVLMWRGLEVKVNYALEKGELKKRVASRIMANTKKILEEASE